MGKPTGFMEAGRELAHKRPVKERVRDWKEYVLPAEPQHLKVQAARCMDCGVPFCHQGCPLGNIIPDWNDLVFALYFQVKLPAIGFSNREKIHGTVSKHKYYKLINYKANA